MIVVEGSLLCPTKVEGIYGVAWWVDVSGHTVYLSMAISKQLGLNWEILINQHSTAQGGGGSFKDRTPREVSCCDAWMAGKTLDGPKGG